MVRPQLMYVIGVLVGGCAADDGVVVGPFTGALHRYVVDDIWLPRTYAQQMEFADDLNQDGTPDNELGRATTYLAGENDLTPHALDMIASGALASSIELRANDLDDDSRVGVWYFGGDGDDVLPIGGRIHDGVFVSNRMAATRPPATVSVRLPVFVDADPVTVTIIGFELDLLPDGQHGYVGLARGGIPVDDFVAGLHAGVTQMIAADPRAHLTFARLLDADRDGQITRTEIETNTIVQQFTSPDLRLNDQPLLSAGFQIHLSACAEGRCNAQVTELCHDRLRDGDETDIDCGGSCLACPGGARCLLAKDCQSRSCGAGSCAAPTCDDSVQDGFESDVDCGGVCPGCASGKSCVRNDDCASKQCVGATIGGTGTCGP